MCHEREGLTHTELRIKYEAAGLSQPKMESLSKDGKPAYFDVVVSPYVVTIGKGEERVLRVSKIVAINRHSLRERLLFLSVPSYFPSYFCKRIVRKSIE